MHIVITFFIVADRMGKHVESNGIIQEVKEGSLTTLLRLFGRFWSLFYYCFSSVLPQSDFI